jgi:hypothetical protein
LPSSSSGIEASPERTALRRVRRDDKVIDLLTVLQRARESGLVAKLRRLLVIRWFVADWARQRALGEREAMLAPAEEPVLDTPDGAWLGARGLTAREYREWSDERRIADDTLKAGPVQFGFTAASSTEGSHPFLVDWLQMYGISLGSVASSGPAPPAGTLAEELIEQGPARFGFIFDLELRVLRELQCTDQIGSLLQ